MVKPSGCIINVSSLMAARGDLGVTAYAASKAGVVGMFSFLVSSLLILAMSEMPIYICTL